MVTAEIAIVTRIHSPPLESDSKRIRSLTIDLEVTPLNRVSIVLSPTALEALAHCRQESIEHLRTAAELITAPATGAFFPLLDHDRAAMSAQLELAAQTHAHHFNEAPAGIWFEDGGYEPRTDDLLALHGLRYVVVDAHAVRCASAVPAFGIHAPISCPGTGVAVFARDREARRVAAAELPDRLESVLDAESRIDGAAIQAWLEAFAGAFVAARVAQCGAIAKRMDRAPLIILPLSLGEARNLVPALEACETLSLTTPSAYLAKGQGLQRAWPGPSRAGGLVAAMCAPERSWLLRHLHAASTRAAELVANGAPEAAARLAVRELMMAQSGDWLRALVAGDPQGRERILDHLRAFARVADDPTGLDPDWASERAAKWPCFADLDPAIFRAKKPPPRVVKPTDRAVDRHAMPRPNEIW